MFLLTTTTTTLLITLSVIVFTYLFMKWLKSVFHFKKLNIPGPIPIPFVGHLFKIIKYGTGEHDIQMTRKYGKFVGYFDGQLPNILTTDVEFIKLMFIKDFNCFVNRRTFDGLQEEPFNKFITVLKDDEWKNVRSIITTAFTGSKLRLMSKTMNTCAENIMKHVEKLEKEEKLFNSKEIYGCYALDVISSCCFGIFTDAINDPDSPFIHNLKEIFSQNIMKNPKLLIIFFAPKLARFLSQKKIMSFSQKEPNEFFKQVSQEILAKRRSKQEARDDFIQIMIDHEESTVAEATREADQGDESDKLQWKPLKKTLTDVEILAQSIVFYIGGYETTSATLNFTTYNLAVYPDVQKKLYDEINDALQEFGELDYDVIMNKLPYLDMIISETLRLYPAAHRINRVASKDYKYGDIIIPKGSTVTVPVWALHRDASIYPEPDKFIPERFADKQRDNFTYLPFGAGPRNCIGMRFALLEIKMLISQVVRNYEILPTEHTPVPLPLAKIGLSTPLKPIIVKLKKRLC